MGDGPDQISVLCVDDNAQISEVIRVKIRLSSGLQWAGSLDNATDLIRRVRESCPDVVLLDVDLPGADPFEAVEELAEHCPHVRVIMFSGHVRRELVDRAVASGAWGYVSKNDDADELVSAIRGVVRGDFVLSPEAQAACDLS